MKIIKIAHLYYDIMNLYGESGNILALTEALKRQGARYSVSNVTKGDKIDYSKFYIFYIGCGTDANQMLVLKDILRYKTEIKKIFKKKVFIATGNSYELFGKKINDGLPYPSISAILLSALAYVLVSLFKKHRQ